jgi:hypothetical protein
MKRRTVLLILLILAAGWLSYLAGCMLLGVSVDERVNQFVADINNGDYGQVYLNFDPDIIDYGGIRFPTFWSDKFPSSGAPYTISSLLTIDPANVTFTLADSAAFPTSWSVKFVMQQRGMDWMIIEMYWAIPPDPLVRIVN